MTFYVGQKVVCVDANPVSSERSERDWPLCLGGVYTVKRTVMLGTVPEHIAGYTYCPQPTTYLVALLEIDNPFDATGELYANVRFRPAVEKGTDKGVELLKKIVDGTKCPVSTHHPEGVV